MILPSFCLCFLFVFENQTNESDRILLLEVTINIATQSLETPLKGFEKVTARGVILTWQELNSWFKQIL